MSYMNKMTDNFLLLRINNYSCLYLFQVSVIIFAVVGTKCSPLHNRESKTEVWPSRKLINREFPTLLTHQEGKRIARAIDSSDVVSNLDELLDTAAQTRYYYYPYFRVRKISKRTYDTRPSNAFSNYANDYDRFPTVA